MEIVIELTKLIGTALIACFVSSGLLMHLVKKHDRVADIEKKFDRLADGVQLGLENDIVIFRAMRNGHINGESEVQEKKLAKYFYECTMKGYDLSKKEAD